MKLQIRTVLLAVCAAAVVLVGRSAIAQSHSTRSVAVAVVDTLSQPGLRAEILRFSDPGKPDVILLRRDAATPENLAAAIASYRESAGRTPARPGLIGRTLVTGATVTSDASVPLRRRAAEILATLRKAPHTKVGNYGRGQWQRFEVQVRG